MSAFAATQSVATVIRSARDARDSGDPFVVCKERFRVRRRAAPWTDEAEPVMLIHPKRLLLLSVLALALAGCATRHEAPTSADLGDDDANCRKNGVAVGSKEYVACRNDRDVQRANAVTRANRAQRNLGEYMLSHPDRQ
jgi:hypothetical protein